MKNRLIYCLIMMLLCLTTRAAAQAALPVAERWEIVTDIYIGVQTAPLSAAEREAYGDAVSGRRGLRVKRVLPGSPAERAGVLSGDLILMNNGVSVARMEDLLLSVRNTRRGEWVHFVMLRGGQKLPLRVQVEALPQPVVVAHATLERRDLPDMAVIAENQSRIAGLLAAEVPDVQAIREEFGRIHALFPSLARPGHVRLYYEAEPGYITVTAYADRITVTAQRGPEVDVYELREQGDRLPDDLRHRFR